MFPVTDGLLLPADQGPRCLPFWGPAISQGLEVLYFRPVEAERAPLLRSDIHHYQLHPFGKNDPRAPLGHQRSWAEDALARQTFLSDRATLGPGGGGGQNELVVDT